MDLVLIDCEGSKLTKVHEVPTRRSRFRELQEVTGDQTEIFQLTPEADI